MTTIRPATAADIPQILACIRALAVYEHEPDAVHATEESLLRHGFGPNPGFGCLMAEQDGRPAGISLYFFSYSTWAGTPGLYIEDLFVYEEFRGQGIGKALIEASSALALERGCSYVHWQVLGWNEPAIGFYRSLGGVFGDEWRNVRLKGEPLARMAQAGAARLAAHNGNNNQGDRS